MATFYDYSDEKYSKNKDESFFNGKEVFNDKKFVMEYNIEEKIITKFFKITSIYEDDFRQGCLFLIKNDQGLYKHLSCELSCESYIEYCEGLKNKNIKNIKINNEIP